MKTEIAIVFVADDRKEKDKDEGESFKDARIVRLLRCAALGGREHSGAEQS